MAYSAWLCVTTSIFNPIRNGSATSRHARSSRPSSVESSSAPSSHRSGSKSSSSRPPGEEVQVGKYHLIKTIGKGNFAKVKLAKHLPTGQEVCVEVCGVCVCV